MSDYIDITFKAGEDLSAKQYYIVKQHSANQTVVSCSGTTDKPLGVLQNKPESGEAAVVRIFGRSNLNADAAMAVNAVVGPAADGQGATYVAGTDTTKYSIGICIRAVDNAGEIAEMVVIPGYAKLS